MKNMNARACWIGWAIIGVAMAWPARADDSVMPHEDRNGILWTVSPMYGWDRNKLKVPAGPGRTMTLKDTGPEYGLFGAMVHPNVVVNDYMFYSHVNDSDVFGNLFFANYYADPKKVLSWNAGVGHLYHKIKPEGEEITVNDPMIKAGPLLHPVGRMVMLNPYVGYVWEQVDTLHGDADNDSYLLGITAGCHWRMLEGTVNYYYQISQGMDENFQVCRARLNTYFNAHWGFGVRVDYMEHQTSDDTSVMFGPVAVW